jgi:hypothetical protein
LSLNFTVQSQCTRTCSRQKHKLATTIFHTISMKLKRTKCVTEMIIEQMISK